ncbi:phosphate uptake regulator PhoU [Candidatus Woesearchaeota archaeon]|jgi:phosphate uptake regulator|nr:phosphate uptake regulator PhoU [Candidatus Woesearchaeota archaeon]MBT3538031.1 phosphate uptake regulator PhoU [Candidatus Woesearchaeota archaeon]MBT4697115.1 phosphate uptake regulator PhoU [Candidatus Woesearchaeota archaeon]MBT4717106.1 phosphate uptake regulator PhoU [Candidatus Woesearchaeota archaeon]MBT7105700.1 phosphate uptake regulator PhoU [Candidatus Woesearchaeota archaeon]
MDRRKLIQHGMSSLTIALPSKWLKERALKKGDSVQVVDEGSKLIVSTDEPLKIEKVSVDVSNLDRTSTLLHIQSLYRYGYNEIEIKFKKQKTIHYRREKEVNFSAVVHEIVNRLIGAEVVEQTENRILVKYLTKEAGQDFKVVLRRAFLLLKEASATLLDGAKNDDKTKIEIIEDMHDNVNKFVNYSLRLLNKYGYPDVKKTCFYYHVIASLDKIMDIMKYSARMILNEDTKFSKTSIEVWENINKSVEMYYEMFYKYDQNLINDIERNRQRVKSQISAAMKKVSREEIRHMSNMKQMLELLLDLADARMGLEY